MAPVAYVSIKCKTVQARVRSRLDRALTHLLDEMTEFAGGQHGGFLLSESVWEVLAAHLS